MKKVLVLLVLALALPTAALAKGPHPHQTRHGQHGRANVMYVLAGTLSGYAAYDPSTDTAGSVTIDVKRSNRHGRLLKGTSVTVSLGADTRIRLRHGLSTITDGDRGIILIRAPRIHFKGSTADDALAALEAGKVRKVIDRGTPSSSSTSF
jgi:hypothetical protein